MAVEKYTALAEVTTTSTSTAITFGSIPQGYRDLRIVGSNIVATSNYSQPEFRLNGDSGSNYSHVQMTGKSWTPTAYTSAGASNLGLILFTGIAPTARLMFTLDIFDYSATNKHKTTIGSCDYIDTSETVASRIANRWANTAAVTSVTIFIGPTYTAPIAAGATFKLFGVK